MSEHDRIRLLIVDDHTMVRRGLVVFLSAFDDLELAGEASSGAEALELCAQICPDVVLMDLVMPDMDGAAATHLIRQTCPKAQVIALTSFGKADLVKAALQAGAIGYLLKNVSAEELAEAVRAAAAGQPTLAKEAFQVLINMATQPTEPTYDLTESERKVLALMSQGLTNAKIAEQLGVSPSTVKTHVSNILSKMGVDSRVEVVRLALQHGLVN